MISEALSSQVGFSSKCHLNVRTASDAQSRATTEVMAHYAEGVYSCRRCTFYCFKRRTLLISATEIDPQKIRGEIFWMGLYNAFREALVFGKDNAMEDLQQLVIHY